jgi:membrane fusion protein, copper/silver efflux system
MKLKRNALALAVVGLAGLGGYGLYWLGMNHGMGMAGHTPGAAADRAAQGGPDGRKVLYWHDPMVPGQRFDKPGKSPFMDMQLVPVYADTDAGGAGSVSISPEVRQNLGIRVAEARTEALAPPLSAVGSVAYNERDVALVQARADGYVEKLLVRAPLDPVRKGQALALLYNPDWVAAQEEFLAAKRMEAGPLPGLVDASRQRMRLAGMREEHIRQVESSGRVQARTTIVAPIAGVVSELTAREGMTVAAGAPMFRINGVSTVWVNAEIPEALAGQLRPGNAVAVQVKALPETTLTGTVSAILPQIDSATRTLQARVELANPGNRLVPGMFATIHFTPNARAPAVTIPSEALIQTGKRSVVMLALGEGKFRPVDVEIGLEANGRTEILRGLDAGQKVVVSGQFLIDSEASLRAVQTRAASAEPASKPDTAQAVHRGSGKVEHIEKDEVTISHGPIPSLQWPDMTMGFALAPGALPAGVAVGDTVSFTFERTGDGEFTIIGIAPLRPAPAGDRKAPQ